MCRWLLTLCALLCARSAAAQDGIGQPIVEVRVEQEGRPVSDPVITGLIETTVGEPLSMRDVRETMTHLMNLRRFEDVQPLAEPVAGGVRVRYRLIPLHPVDRVEFRGRLGLSDGDVRRIVSDRFGTSPAATRTTEIVDTLRAEYRRRGYPAATFVPRIVETHDPDRATMVIDVDAGRRALISNVQVFQVDAEEATTLIGVPDVETGRPYDAAEVDRELQKWVDDLKERGYYEARASHGVTMPDDAFVTVNVARGPRVVIAFSGDALPENERERLVPVREEGSADEDLLEDANRAITNYLLARGYRDARVSYTSSEGDGELTITFSVTRGPRYVVDGVVFSGNVAIPTAELAGILRVEDGDPFVQSTLAGRAAAIANVYRARGYTKVQVTPAEAVLPASATETGDRRVEVSVPVVEGPRTVVRSVSFEGQTVLTERELRTFAVAAVGRAYSQSDVANGRDQIDLEYRNRGYETVTVTANAALAEGDTQADIRYTITEGPQFIVDHIIIIGNERTSVDTISRELLLKEGAPLGYSALVGSRARLAALGLFRRVDVQAVPHAGEPRRDVLVQVEEADPTTLGVGGGLEGGFVLRTGEDGQAEEQFELAPRGFFEIGRRNLWGKNRSINLATRVSLRSRDTVVREDGVLVEDPTQRGYGFHEYRVVGTFREPTIFRSAADVLVTGILEQAIRTSFNFSRRVVRAEAGLRLSPLYSTAGRYSYEHTRLFDERNITPEEQPLIDRLFPQVRISKFAGSLLRDTRDDPLDSSRGTFLIADGDLAARAIASEVGFIKTYVQAFTYRQLPTSRRIVVALAARVGAAHGFPREVARVDDTGAPVLGPDGIQIVDTVRDELPASERFFAGGETTVRGFALDRLGGPGTISESGFPTGGNSVVVLNSELRVTLSGPLQAVGFLDAGNVFRRAGDLDLTDLRPAAGIGMRYRSPVGPIRIDWGFNLRRRELVPGTLERGNVVHISLGQAF